MNNFMKMFMKKSATVNNSHEKREKQPEPIFVPAPKEVEKPVDYLPEFDKLSEAIDKLSEAVDNSKKETFDNIHNENVRVYRNVQAVVVDEAKKLSDGVKKSDKKVMEKVNIALIFSILACSFAFLDLLFDILCKFQVF